MNFACGNMVANNVKWRTLSGVLSLTMRLRPAFSAEQSSRPIAAVAEYSACRLISSGWSLRSSKIDRFWKRG
jgi:hypothetical protein